MNKLIGDVMKRGYYIHFQGRTSIGVSKKIDMQMEELAKCYDMYELEIDTCKRNLLQRVWGLFPTASITRDYKRALERLDNPAFIYVRRAVADRAYVGFWREIKKRYPKCKIIIEIFTYPYDKDDFGKWNAWPFFIKEVVYRCKLKKYVDRFVTYSTDAEIFGIPTIRTTNGINVDNYMKIRGDYRENKIVLLGVAYMQRQHGYERVIEGMRDYYERADEGKCQVYLYLVGDGPEKRKYQELTEKYGLQKYIKFYPVTVGQELDELYDQADIALAAFGMYKVAYDEPIGALKTRECMAKGIPMISGSPIDVLQEEFPYAKVFPNNESAIDITEVVSFWKEIKAKEESKQKLADKIRSYAKENVSMSALMRPIIDYIEQ